VAEDERPPRADVVDVFRAVGAEEIRALAARDEDGLASDGAEGAYRAVHAAGDDALGALEEGSGLGVAHDAPSLAGQLGPASLIPRPCSHEEGVSEAASIQ
jgi:hypothetical protein